MKLETLEPYIKPYVEILNDGNPHEIYKWEARQNFQNRWDIEAEDFKQMFESSLQASNENLWSSLNYYPKSMILQFADIDATRTRELFRRLFDESDDLADRIHAFLKGCDDLTGQLEVVLESEKPLTHYHRDMRAISFYLGFRYPETYFPYKFTMAKKTASLCAHDPLSSRWDPAEKYLWFLKMVGEIRDWLLNHQPLKSAYDEFLGSHGFQDPVATLMAPDFLFQVTEQRLEAETSSSVVTPPPPPAAPLELPSKNVIYYGPPGTGKTYWMQNSLIRHFSEQTTAESEEERLSVIARSYPWWQIVGAVLLDMGEATVPELQGHKLIRAKEMVSDQKNPRAMLWAMLQQHTVLDCEEVQYSRRYEPLFFWKSEGSRWSVVTDRAELEVPELQDILSRARSDGNRGLRINRYEFITFHPSYAYEDFVEGIRPVLSEEAAVADAAGDIGYLIKPGVLRSLAERAAGDPDHNYALFVDEINRANVSAVFGELITLIEDDKRSRSENALSTVLPYSRTDFAVPSNLYLIGTMNTADRSVEALDTALRRRFSFIEFEPDPSVLAEDVDGVNLKRMLEVMNSRIERLAGRDYRIGHAYLIRVSDEDTLGELRLVFKNQIIPLLQEYFYGDWAKIGLVLGTAFVRLVSRGAAFAVFPSDDYRDFEDAPVYDITPSDDWTLDDFKSIYEG